MARHRDIRNLDLDEEYDEAWDDTVYGRSVDEYEFGTSPSSEQYLYNHSRDNFGTYFPSSEGITEEEDYNDDQVDYQKPELSPEDEARLQSVMDQLQGILGNSVTAGEMRAATIEGGYDMERVLDKLLNRQQDSSAAVAVANNGATGSAWSGEQQRKPSRGAAKTAGPSARKGNKFKTTDPRSQVVACPITYTLPQSYTYNSVVIVENMKFDRIPVGRLVRDWLRTIRETRAEEDRAKYRLETPSEKTVFPLPREKSSGQGKGQVQRKIDIPSRNLYMQGRGTSSNFRLGKSSSGQLREDCLVSPSPSDRDESDRPDSIASKVQARTVQKKTCSSREKRLTGGRAVQKKDKIALAKKNKAKKSRISCASEIVAAGGEFTVRKTGYVAETVTANTTAIKPSIIKHSSDFEKFPAHQNCVIGSSGGRSSKQSRSDVSEYLSHPSLPVLEDLPDKSGILVQRGSIPEFVKDIVSNEQSFGCASIGNNIPDHVPRWSSLSDRLSRVTKENSPSLSYVAASHLSQNTPSLSAPATSHLSQGSTSSLSAPTSSHMSQGSSPSLSALTSTYLNLGNTPSLSVLASSHLSRGSTPSLSALASSHLSQGNTPSLSALASNHLSQGNTLSLSVLDSSHLSRGSTPSLSALASSHLNQGSTPSLSPLASSHLSQGCTPSLSALASSHLSQINTPSLSALASSHLRQCSTPSLSALVSSHLNQSSTPSLSALASSHVSQGSSPSFSALSSCHLNQRSTPSHSTLDSGELRFGNSPKHSDLASASSHFNQTNRPSLSALASNHFHVIGQPGSGTSLGSLVNTHLNPLGASGPRCNSPSRACIIPALVCLDGYSSSASPIESSRINPATGLPVPRVREESFSSSSCESSPASSFFMRPPPPPPHLADRLQHEFILPRSLPAFAPFGLKSDVPTVFGGGPPRKMSDDVCLFMPERVMDSKIFAASGSQNLSPSGDRRQVSDDETTDVTLDVDIDYNSDVDDNVNHHFGGQIDLRVALAKLQVQEAPSDENPGLADSSFGYGGYISDEDRLELDVGFVLEAPYDATIHLLSPLSAFGQLVMQSRCRWMVEKQGGLATMSFETPLVPFDFSEPPPPPSITKTAAHRY